MQVYVQNLSFVYEDSAVLALNDVSASFGVGWTGIVGANGSGKSTLLKILCKQMKQTSGELFSPLYSVYCEQATEAAPPNLLDFASDYSNLAIDLRVQLEIEDEWLWRYESLSHGERKRIQIACALASEPSLFALDEPTNHLDGNTRRIVLGALQDFKGVGLIVSHDSFFLDRLVYQTLFMNSGRGILLHTGYSEGVKQLELERSSTIAARKQSKKTLARLSEESNRRREQTQQGEARRSAKKLDKHDSDGRARIGLAIVTGQDGKRGRLSAQMDKRLSHAQEMLENSRVEKVYEKSLDIIAEPLQRKVLLGLDAGVLNATSDFCIEYPTLYVANTDRIGLRGDNGTGKSSFLRFLISQLSEDIKLAYIPQEMSSAESRELLSAIKELSQEKLGRILSIVARLNSPPERLLSGIELSPGELRKLMLARCLIEGPHLIIMDEPTNHLDIQSIRALEAVLKDCNCALILVSHEQDLLDSLTQITWRFDIESNSPPTDDRFLATQKGNEKASSDASGKTSVLSILLNDDCADAQR